MNLEGKKAPAFELEGNDGKTHSGDATEDGNSPMQANLEFYLRKKPRLEQEGHEPPKARANNCSKNDHRDMFPFEVHIGFVADLRAARS